MSGLGRLRESRESSYLVIQVSRNECRRVQIRLYGRMWEKYLLVYILV